MPVTGSSAIGRGIKTVGGLNYHGQGVIERWQRLNIGATPTGSEQDTGWDLPANALVTDVFVRVITPEATGGTKTLDVGLLSSESGGDADGFIDGVSVATAGLVVPNVTLTAGATETYVSSWTVGVLLTSGVPLAGTNTVGDEGSFYREWHPTSAVTAKSISYTAGSNDFAEFRGAIFIHYYEFT